VFLVCEAGALIPAAVQWFQGQRAGEAWQSSRKGVSEWLQLLVWVKAEGSRMLPVPLHNIYS